MRSDRLRLQDALDQIQFIREFAARGKQAFFNDPRYKAQSCTD